MIERIPKDFVAEVAAKLAAKRGAASVSPSGSPATAFAISPYHEAAAVLARFDPATLRPRGVANASQDLGRLLSDSIRVANEDGDVYWAIKPDVRIATLRRLREAGTVTGALEANPERAAIGVQPLLESYLRGSADPLDDQQLQDLAAIHEVVGWLRPAGFQGLPDPDAIARRTEWLALLEPFEHLAGQHFRGRADEMSKLRSYAEVLPPGTTLEHVGRAVRNVFSLNEKPPLLIYGPGGVGKSTLLARFILEHAKAHQQDRFPFAYLDYDRPDVALEEPLTLLVEAVRQLGIEYPDARENCELIRKRWLDILTDAGQEAPTEAAAARASSQLARVRTLAVRDFSALVATLGATGRPVLLVLDTFEEVQWVSEEHVATVWRLLERLQSALPRLRVVLAGRAELRKQKTLLLPLKGLDEEAAIGYLQARGVRDPEVARRLARQIGGSPLSLRLAAELVEKEGLPQGGNLDLSTREYFFLRMDDALIQRQLYKRILGHIHDPQVRKLAHPGLVLRRLTPELILEVLAKPCGLALSSLDDAEAIFAKLRNEVSLVSPERGALVHRQDLRVLMLQLLQDDEPEKARAIHEGAVRYYQGRPARPRERAEEIYHRLWLDQDPAAIAGRWLKGVESHLASALEEFSGARRAFLASRLGHDVDDETRRLADLEDWERLTERKVHELLAEDLPEEALKLLSVRKERSSRSPLVQLEASTLARLKRWDESLVVLNRGIERAIETGERARAVALSLQAAEVAISVPRVSNPIEVSDRLYRLANGASPIERLQILPRIMALSRLDASLMSTDGALEREIGSALDGVSDEALLQLPTACLWTAAVLGTGEEARMGRLIRLTGLPRGSTEALRHLAAQVTAFDVAVSQQAAESMGMLARRFQVPPQTTLTASWTEFVLGAAESVVNEVMVRLLEVAVSVDFDLVPAFAAVMWSALGLEHGTTDRPSPPSASLPPALARVPGATAREAVEALAEAFPDRNRLRLLLFRTDRDLEAIVGPSEDHRRTVHAVVKTADSQGWLLSLVAHARETSPTHAGLINVAEDLGLPTLPGKGPRPDVERLFDASVWRERLGEIEGQVCRVEVEQKPVGTGFCVNADMVLVAESTLGKVLGGATRPQVTLRFDYKTDAQGRTVTDGNVFTLQTSGWLVAHSPTGDGPEQLGYALLVAQNSPGAQPIGGAVRDSAAAPRRWVEDFGLAPSAGEPLLRVHYPPAGALRLDVGSEAVLGVSEDGTRLFYTMDTPATSSGAPCLSSKLDVVALHIGDSRTHPQAPRGSSVAVLMNAVLRDLQRRGFGGLVGARYL